MRYPAINSVSLPAPSRGKLSLSRVRLRRRMLELRLRGRDAWPVLQRALAVLVTGLVLMLLSPLLALVALGIKLTSKGPVLFRQERIGKHGRRFVIFKFRTMYVGADAMKARLTPDAGQTVRFKMRRDPRITPVGRVLRRLSIDELPQLYNVLVGDMALIGPRPPLWAEVVKYDAEAMRRLEVTQGLTCHWQIEGRSDLSFEQQVKLDIDYIDRARPIDELRILARTIPAILGGRGAY
jgi:lipopolysaccharide/colanic/teichoic acid biosynthesis glycosyltransferase